MEHIDIYLDPLDDEEFYQHMMEGKILGAPARYNLIDILKCLKFGRPAAGQSQLDEFIAFLELDPKAAEPFDPDILNQTWDK